MGIVRTYGSVHATCDVRGCTERSRYMLENGYYVCAGHGKRRHGKRRE